MLTKFQQKVYDAVRKIPRGKVASYQQVAIFLGKKYATRAVGQALNKNPFAPKTPCHRVVYKNGQLGGYKFGCRNKRQMLLKEGIKFNKNNRVLSKYFLKIK
ncbi:MAG: MGMT family protein [Patescibacteria group bacterium]|nr:MGMT family protein [Patescibacteria group bacterium]MDD5121069.1 MGMT family protein [Patescibacteria group bacterium]MDD5221569.1 MGMT family protein [Patescibacteria group bacterium]MDD5396012.1 MGMT family protein [Patescibacteria group bacterium]